MKILALRFNNLNSLAGEWSIDFTDPEYLANGIFAIIGPTGAGKSTILDAICLALYAETPRLGKITKSSNEIMARQTGECFSEVEFETAKGRFRCHFSQRRAYGKAHGELQHQKHEIVDGLTDKPLETRLRLVVAMVTEVTGMDFDRFTRSILLAQGGFSKFLLAHASERAPILEKITGTEIYSRISIKVHEQLTVQQKKQELLNNDLGAMQLLSTEERELAVEDLQKGEVAAAALGQEINQLLSALSWLENMAKLQQDILGLENTGKDLLKCRQAMAPALLRLAGAEQAAGLEAEYIILDTLRKQQQDDIARLAEKEKAVKKLTAEQQGVIKDLRTVEDAFLQVNNDKQQEAALLVQVRALDTQLGVGRNSLNNLVAEARVEEKNIATLRGDLAGAAAKVFSRKKELLAVDSYLSSHKGDEFLLENLAAIRHCVGDAVGLDKKNSKNVQALAAAAGAVKKAALDLVKKEKIYALDQEKFETQKNGFEKISQGLKALLGGRSVVDLRQSLAECEQRSRDCRELSAALQRIYELNAELAVWQEKSLSLQQDQGRLVNEVGTVRENLCNKAEILRHLTEKRDLLNQVLSLEEQRRRLVDNKPCPLCGALEHPYAKGNIPSIAELEGELQAAQVEMERLNSQLSKLQVKKATVGKDLEQCGNDIKRLDLVRGQEEERASILVETLDLAVTLENRRQVVAGGQEKTDTQVGKLKADLQVVEDNLRQEQEIQQKISSCRDKLDASGKARDGMKNRHEALGKEVAYLEIEGENLQRDLQAALKIVDTHLSCFAVEKFSAAEADEIMRDLERRREAWKNQRSAKEKIERQIVSLENDKKTIKALMAKQRSGIVDKRRALKTSALALHRLYMERRGLYADKNPDQEEKRLAAGLAAAEKNREAVKNKLSILDRQQHGLQVEVDSLTLSVRNRRLELSDLEEKWLRDLHGADFKDEAGFLEIRMDNKERDSLAAKRDNLAKEEIELAAQLADRRDSLQKERSRQLTKQSSEELQQAKAGRDAELQQVQQQIGAIKQRLEQDKKNQQQQRHKIKELEVQKKECGRWEQLHALIGSSDGKKFRMFAQGLTFEMMITHANKKLREMSDRYVLIRDDEQPLELGVIDDYQAGEIRSTKNLSGGESFIVSLALALGLSNMASRNVRVDSLFLDEGFGTLDEDALETALATLSGLHQDGKLIGVISHVPALKERIAAQIQVVPGAGGRSRLLGPGCSHLIDN